MKGVERGLYGRNNFDLDEFGPPEAIRDPGEFLKRRMAHQKSVREKEEARRSLGSSNELVARAARMTARSGRRPKDHMYHY